MNARMHKATEQMIDEFRGWVKSLAEDAGRVRDVSGVDALERRIRQEGQSLLGQTFQGLLQVVVDNLPAARACPRCGANRRHKGRRERGLISSVGAIRLTGPYWYCRGCGGQHALEALAGGSVSRAMRELLCLLGTALASFAKAEAASKKLLGVMVSEAFIRRLCRREGHTVKVRPVVIDGKEARDLVGSCDGTMVNTTQLGWKELKAYQFRHGGHRHGRAYMESSDDFLLRVRHAAVKLKAGRAQRFFWVSDAADWINKGISKQLPAAKRIVDLWHAYQHVHEASRKIFGEGTTRAKQWAKKYCDELRRYGGWTVWNSLRRVRYKASERQEALEALLTFLRRNADRMDYPTYQRAGWPISSGPMESFCKQLGQRLKGPGMRWSIRNIDPMATLVSLWSNEEWDTHWESAA
jgi:hypothetical protein